MSRRFEAEAVGVFRSMFKAERTNDQIDLIEAALERAYDKGVDKGLEGEAWDDR